MSSPTDQSQYEKVVQQFVEALDDADLEALDVLWGQAVADPELGRLFCEISEAIYSEEVPGFSDPESDSPGISAVDIESMHLSRTAHNPSKKASGSGGGMLVLSRKLGEKIVIDDNIIVTIVKIDRNQIRIGIEAPHDATVYREEIRPKGSKVSGDAPVPSSPVPKA